MGKTLRSVIWWASGCLAVWLMLAPTGRAIDLALVLPSCPEGATPEAFVRLAGFEAPDVVPAGASVEIARITLAAGEVVRPQVSTYTVFYVESGTLKFQMPLRGGFHLEHPAHCAPAGGVYSGGGVLSVDAEGWMRVEAGSALVAEEVKIEQIGNAGTTPVELLQVTLLLPELIPETGQPVTDELVTDLGKRERRNDRRDGRDATPTP
jgi:hypothetical protein